MPASPPAQSGLFSSPPDDPHPCVEAWQNVLHLGQGLDDSRLIAEIGCLSGLTSDHLPVHQTRSVEVYADVRFHGQTESLQVRVEAPTLEHIHHRFLTAYTNLHRSPPPNEPIEILTLRLKRFALPRA